METEFMNFRVYGLYEYILQKFLSSIDVGTPRAVAAVCFLAKQMEEAENTERWQSTEPCVGAVYDELDGCGE